MGEKRVFEGEVFGVIHPGKKEPHNYMTFNSTVIDTLAEDKDGFPILVSTWEILDDFKDKKVRITIETLDDDHLEMEKLERE
jgi:hypothetical protein